MMSTKSTLTILPNAIVCECDESIFRGNIIIGSGCIVHPRARIYAKSGPIVFGDHCIIEEYATIIHDTGNNDSKETMLTIGSNNIFEVRCTVEASAIGDKNVFEPHSYVSNRVKVSNNCVIGAGCSLIDEHVLPENAVIFGKKCEQREAIERPGSLTSQLDFLRKVLPNYHHLRKSTPTASDVWKRGQ